MEYTETYEDNINAGFAIIFKKLKHSNAIGGGSYIVRCDDVHANPSKHKINERIQFAHRDERHEWKWDSNARLILRHYEHGKLMIADDFRRKILLGQFTLMDLRLDTNF